MHRRMRPQNKSAPHWSSKKLEQIAEAYDRFVKPLLLAIATISAFMSANGILSQFINPEFSDFVLCLGIGFALYCIALIFWAGAWHVPEFETRFPIVVYLFFTVAGFLAYASVSVTANLSATGGSIAAQLVQEDQTNELANEGPKVVLYVDQLVVVGNDLTARAGLARQSERDEIAGRGPTGVGGSGPVSNSFGASAQKYDAAAASLAQMLSRSQTHSDAFDAIIAEMRAVQADVDITNAERAATLKALTGKAIGEIRSLLAIDPVRTIQAAADTIATGVPPRSGARASSQARIAEISQEMRLYADQMRKDAERIATLAPIVPEQVTLSQTEMLIAAAWRMPGLTMAALLLDICGFVAIGFRLALYSALKAKISEETESPLPTYVTLEDFWRVEGFVERAAQASKSVADAKAPSRKGRPPSPKVENKGGKSYD